MDGVVWFFDNVGPLINFNTTIKNIGRAFPKDFKINNPHINLEIMEFVDGPSQIIPNSTALLTPLFAGAGTKVKVVETLACGVPAIGNEIAFEGLPYDFTDSMILCHEPEESLKAMRNVKFTIEERLELKRKFISSYQSGSIKDYITKNIK